MELACPPGVAAAHVMRSACGNRTQRSRASFTSAVVDSPISRLPRVPGRAAGTLARKPFDATAGRTQGRPRQATR